MQNNKIVIVAPLGVGGVTTMMINIQKNINRENLNFDYFVYHDRHEPCEDQVIDLGSKKIIASADDIGFKPLRRLVRMYKIAKVCKKEQIKVIHFNAANATELTNIIAAKLGGVKFISIHSHNAGYGRTSKSQILLSEIMKPFLPLFCDAFFACSKLAAEFMFPKSIINSGKYTIIPNGIELDKFAFNSAVRGRVRAEIGIDDKFVIGHAGRFNPQKNHEFLIDIFERVYQKNSNAVLLLFGVGEKLEAIKTRVRDKNLEEVVYFMGATDRMHEMWQAFDVFLMPSLHEGLPVTGIEAQASGLPCVFSDAITKEVGLASNTCFIPLSASVDIWADKILSFKDSERINTIDILKEAKYDIQSSADSLSDYYINVLKNI